MCNYPRTELFPHLNLRRFKIILHLPCACACGVLHDIEAYMVDGKATASIGFCTNCGETDNNIYEFKSN